MYPSGASERPQQCPPGTFCRPSSVKPEVCPASFFCRARSGGPSPCESGYYCPKGSWDQLPCPNGWFCPEGSESPEPCPAGQFCSKDDEAVVGNPYEPKDHEKSPPKQSGASIQNGSVVQFVENSGASEISEKTENTMLGNSNAASAVMGAIAILAMAVAGVSLSRRRATSYQEIDIADFF